MSAKELSNEKNIVSVEITVSAEDFQKAIKQSYNKNKKHFTIQGFRKGKAPRKLIEAHYGKGVFYEDAVSYTHLRGRFMVHRYDREHYDLGVGR